MGVALSTNLFSLFVFYEILTVATYPLVVHRETGEALSAGLKYLAYNWSGGVAILAGMLILMQTVGTLAFVPGGNSGIAGVGGGYNGEWWMLLILVAASVLNLAYFLPVIIRAFFRPGKGEIEGVRLTLRGPVVATACRCAFLRCLDGVSVEPVRALCADRFRCDSHCDPCIRHICGRDCLTYVPDLLCRCTIRSYCIGPG